MSYTISQVAQMMGVTPSTLRYYDKEGLLPNVKRVNGIRVFEDTDFPWLRILNCLKGTGMPIKNTLICARKAMQRWNNAMPLLKSSVSTSLIRLSSSTSISRNSTIKTGTTKKQSRPVPKKPSIIPTASLIYPWTRFQE